MAGDTYKADVADIRESPSVPVAELLIERGAVLSYLDPFVDSWIVAGKRIPASDPTKWGAEEFDCVILLQNHREFLDLDFPAIASIVLDTRGQLVGEQIRRL